MFLLHVMIFVEYCTLISSVPMIDDIIATAREDCQQRRQKRYAVDVICLVHTGKADNLQDTNTVDVSSIVFTREDKENNNIPFLDARFTKTFTMMLFVISTDKVYV